MIKASGDISGSFFTAGLVLLFGAGRVTIQRTGRLLNYDDVVAVVY